MKFKTAHSLLLPTLLLLSTFFFTGCVEDKPVGEKQIHTVDARPVTTLETDLKIPVSGSIHPLKTVKFGFMVAGKIKAVNVRVGDFVEKNQIIAMLDPTDYKNGLQIAEARYIEISSEYKRLTRLHKKGSITPNAYDKIVAGRSQAEANYRIYKKKVSDTILKSPVSGFISRKVVEAGEIVDQGDPCFTVVKTSTVEARMAVPESEIALVKKGQKADVTVPAIGKKIFEGVVTQIVPVADPLTRTFNVKIMVSNPEDIIRAGMIALARIDVEKKIKILTIPGEAVVRSPDNLLYVFTVDAKSTVSKKRITRSSVSGQEIVIDSGLTKDDLVVTAGKEQLTDGMSVIINRENSGK